MVECQDALQVLRKVRYRWIPCTAIVLLDQRLILGESRSEFEKSIGLDKKDFGAIEYLLRKGQRQLDIYLSPGIKDIR